MRLPSCLLIAATTACTGTTSGPMPPDPPEANHITINYNGSPGLLAYRDGDGAWQSAEPGGPGLYIAQVTGPYRIASACVHASGNVFTTLLARTPDDGDAVTIDCIDYVKPVSATVTGTMQEPGTVIIGPAAASGTSAPWNFALAEVPVGTNDLVALGGGRVLIHRDVTITGDTAMPALDLASGEELSSVGLTLHGINSTDFVTSGAWLETAHGSATIPSDHATTVELVPTSMLAASDRQHLEISATDGSAQRTVLVDHYTGSPTTFVVPPPVTVDFAPAADGLAASWRALPSYDSLSLELFAGQAGSYRTIDVEATQSFIAAAGDDRLAVEYPDGYDAAWKLDTTASFTATFTASSSANGVTYRSERSQDYTRSK